MIFFLSSYVIRYQDCSSVRLKPGNIEVIGSPISICPIFHPLAFVLSFIPLPLHSALLYVFRFEVIGSFLCPLSLFSPPSSRNSRKVDNSIGIVGGVVLSFRWWTSLIHFLALDQEGMKILHHSHSSHARSSRCDPFSITIFSNSVQIENGSMMAFTSNKNHTSLHLHIFILWKRPNLGHLVILLFYRDLFIN